MAEKRKKIVIHGCTGLKNSGDEAILQAIVQQYGKQYEITAISKDMAYTKKQHPDVRVIPDEKKICRAAIRECDLFLLGGGGLLQDETTVFNVSVWLRYLKYAMKIGKKVCLYGNSIGPLRLRWNRYLVKKYLSKVDLITLRDKDSAALLEQIGIDISEKVHVTADPVFSLEWAEEETVENGTATEWAETGYVCMALRHWFDIIPFIPVRICNQFNIRSAKNKVRYERYIETMAGTTAYINNELGYPVVFASFLCGRDDKVARDIMERVTLMGDKSSRAVGSGSGAESSLTVGSSSEAESGLTVGGGNKLLAGETLTPGDVIRVIANARFLVGMRLHSIIYAICTATPMVIVNYSAKVKAMAKLNGLDRYLVDVDDMDENKLKDKISLMLAEESLLTEKLQKQRQIMREKERENKKLIEGLMEH